MSRRAWRNAARYGAAFWLLVLLVFGWVTDSGPLLIVAFVGLLVCMWVHAHRSEAWRVANDPAFRMPDRRRA